MRSFSAFLLILAVLPAGLAPTAGAADADGILFLHLTMVGTEVRLDSTSTTPGHLKSPRHVELFPDRVHFVAKSASHEVVFEGTTDDPLRAHYEYVDEKGDLQTVIIQSDSASFTIRVPDTPRLNHVDFSRVEVESTDNTSRSIREVSLGSVAAKVVKDE